MHERTITVGHALVVAGLIVLAVWSLTRFVLGLRTMAGSFVSLPPIKGGEALGFSISISALAWIPAFICAWGIWKWRRWGQILVIALCGLLIVLELQGLIFFGRAYLAPSWIATMVVSLVLIVWLSLPPLRTRFRI